ncbi:hypothetical protein [Chitinophaga qingshengii]|uniref:Immunity protein Imm1 n=1 Tax=Chitinophaga qingshengii TaxID=1569794 RepID=A0ABR7TPU8_9BACT|nr:hypothetical protein [Chitinophaga qingshengii]MBC9932498.1 hypothetical protein [Chitinophaga qingshengii]
MFVKLLMIDHQPAGDDYIIHPNLDDVLQSCRQLNGSTRTYIGLYATETPNADEFMLVGGGGSHYTCCYYKDGDEYYLLNPHVNNPDQLVHIPIGQLNIKPMKYCSSSMEDILQALQTYCTTGEMDAALTWELS